MVYFGDSLGYKIARFPIHIEVPENSKVLCEEDESGR